MMIEKLGLKSLLLFQENVEPFYAAYEAFAKAVKNSTNIVCIQGLLSEFSYTFSFLMPFLLSDSKHHKRAL